MKKGTIIIRQTATKASKRLGIDKMSPDGKIGGFTMMPNSSRTHSIRRNDDGTFKTGLDYEKEAERIQNLEKILGADLSNTSPFWNKLRIDFDFRGNIVGVWNIEDPITYLKYKAAIANGFLAPSEEDIKNTEKYKDAIFYVYDASGLMEKKIKLAELKDEVTTLIFKLKGEKEKLLYILHAIGDKPDPKHSDSALYTLLSERKESYVKREQYENLLNVLQTPIIELQAAFILDKAISMGIVKYDKQEGCYYYGADKLKNTIMASKEYLLKEEKESLLFKLSEEVWERL